MSAGIWTVVLSIVVCLLVVAEAKHSSVTVDHEKTKYKLVDNSLLITSELKYKNKLSENKLIKVCEKVLSTKRSMEHGEETDSMDYIAKGYRKKGEGWFKLNNELKSWVDARRACLAEGAHLAVPDTVKKAKVRAHSGVDSGRARDL